eukprot:CAMPEP_0194748906 /NCGR_PEP_ID=MMETSP0323_2-20130528/3089_1 /TAXON_ID=2866 ORGANISM="Crypthecodinium cohnii, Strain Seligo" /NCGR_SAMPLE_ID=MMETSP0323_2 /ASSEMBLY_ACC=CAM_ASM_000346 /LENGTH=239 /DNA_ID=CAMNT_0039663571 /DNA_START=83 /DNA_END=799 /DNA_ORIENTATION=-
MSSDSEPTKQPPPGCPMHRLTGAGSSAAPPPAAANSDQNACPMRGANGQDKIDPRNMMPVFSQEAASGQSTPLSKDREVSSIPKADEAGNWVYPSSQQFYHALLRRNKEADADAMDAVVFAHNVTNEKTWKKIMEWEKFHERVCPTPKLLRFVGRSEELSHGAWLTSKVSYMGKPFDRHDWFVDRCGQKTVRYVIDYYDDPCSKEDGLEITIDARPAFDSFGAVVDRIRRPGYQAKRVW